MNYYGLFLYRITKYFKKEEWLKKGETFFFNKNNNWGLINFQKSRDSTNLSTKFTINLGVSSTTLRKFEGDDVNLKPEIWGCHWQTRIGWLLPEKNDKWWIIDSNIGFNETVTEIKKIIELIAIPEIERNISDDALEKKWISEDFNGLTELQGFIYLTTLLKIYNKENLQSVVEKLKQMAMDKPYESTVKVHVKSLGL